MTIHLWQAALVGLGLMALGGVAGLFIASAASLSKISGLEAALARQTRLSAELRGGVLSALQPRHLDVEAVAAVLVDQLPALTGASLSPSPFGVEPQSPNDIERRVADLAVAAALGHTVKLGEYS